MKYWSLNKKILSILTLLILFAAGVNVFSVSELGKLNNSLKQIVDINVPRIITSGEIIEQSRLIAVEEREAYLAGTDSERNSALKKLDAAKSKIDKNYETIFPNLSPEGKELAKKFKTGLDAYWRSVETVKDLLVQNRTEGTDKLLKQAIHQGTMVRREATSALEELITLNHTRLEKSAKDSDETYQQSRYMILLLSIMSALGGLALSFVVLKELSTTIDRVISSLSAASQQVAQASEQIAQAAEELSQASNEQASSLQETSSSTEQINSMIQKNTENAKSTAASAQRSLRSAENGKQTVEGMVGAIRKLEESNQEIAAIVNVFSEIQEKAKVIDEIVFQTQLLSFNASVEAARAGEYGKGFAVVAEEVGNLAEMSGIASGEIGELLAGSLKKVENTVKDVQTQITKLAEEGNQGIVVLDEIVQEAKTANTKTLEISQACEEQSRGIKEIAVAMTQLDQGTQQNAATSDETASASEELSGQAVALKNTVQELVAVIKGSNGKPIDHESESHDPMSVGRNRNSHPSSLKSKKAAGANKVIALKSRTKFSLVKNEGKLNKAVGAEEIHDEEEDDFVNL